MSLKSLPVLTFAALMVAAPAAHAQNRDAAVLCMTLEPPILDPTAGAAQAIKEVTYNNIFETLVSIDSSSKLQPRLAQSWTLATDNVTYTFKLRSGVKFHDGSDLTSADVKYSFERAVGPNSKNAQKASFTPIESIATPDPLTVVIKLKQPTAHFLNGIAIGDASIVSEKTAATNETRPNGTGGYKYVDWRRGDRVIYTRNDAYWGKKPAIKDITYRFIPDPQAQFAAIQAGDCDAITNFGASESVDALKKNPALKVMVGATEGETIMSMNSAKPPFNDVRVRRAMAHAIDRKAVIEGAMNGNAVPIGSHFSPNHPAYVDLTGSVPYDPAKARALLREAGFPNGFSVSMKLPPPSYARRSGEVIAAMLAEVGVKVSIEPVEFPQWLERVFRNKEFDLSIIAHTEPLDIGVYARPEYYFQYGKPAFQALNTSANGEMDEARRNAIYGDMQRMLVEDQVNVFLFMLPKTTVAKKDLDGMWQNWPIPVSPATELSWK